MSFKYDFRYVQAFLKSVGVRIKSEPGEYTVIRAFFDAHGILLGPSQERQSFETLRDAFIYGLQLALLPPFYRFPAKARRPRETCAHNARAYEIRRKQAEACRGEIEAEKAAAIARRETMIRAELARLGCENS